MGYIIGLIIIAISIVIALRQRKKASADLLEINYMQTSSIADAAGILAELDGLSTGTRHYVELKGKVGTETPQTTPYAKMQVAYYRSECHSVTEETTVTNGRTSTSQSDKKITEEHSHAPFYITDGSSQIPVYVDIESFGENVRLVSSCNRLEPPGSDWCRQNGFGSDGSNPFQTGGSFAYSVRFDSPARSGLLPTAGGAAVLPRSGLLFAAPRGARSGKPGGGSFGSPSRGPRAGRPGGGPSRPSGGFGGPRPGGSAGGFGARPHNPAPRRPAPRGNTGGSFLGGMMVGSMMNSGRTSHGSHGSSRLLGYRLIEEIVPIGQEVYLIGDLYRNGDKYYIGASADTTKPTFFSCKSEEELARELKGKKSGSIGIAVVGILIGLLVMWLLGGF